MTTRRSQDREPATDVIVVGTGGCGLTAALAAAQKGARVLVLEKESWPGGNTALTSGITAAGSRFQREAGIEDDPARLAEEILGRNGGHGDARLTQRLTEYSATVLEWLADTLDTKFEVGAITSGHTTRRGHSCGGGWAFIEHLMSAVERTPSINVRWSTAALSLNLDASGAVTGVVTNQGVISARKVILATGGFGASRERLREYIPAAAELPYHGHRGNTGDGLQMGMAAGAAARHLDGYLLYPSYFAPLRIPVPQPIYHLGAILVDATGGRFADETKYPGGPSSKMLTLPGKQAYAVFNEGIRQAVLRDRHWTLPLSILATGDTPEELARSLGISPSGLARTIQALNSSVARGQDGFGRRVTVPLGLPLYGVKVWAALYCTLGGLRVNTNGQVLRPDDSVIQNLYAGGDASEGLSGPGPAGYYPGNGVMAAIGLGKLAGEHAAYSAGAAG
jgi:fumarate reductase flavoprotein subunit